MTLRDLLSSRDVIKPQVNLNFAEIKRLEGEDLNPVTIPFNLGEFLEGGEDKNPVLQEYDTVVIYDWEQRDKVSVTSSGMLHEPGEFRLVPGMRIKDLVDVSGGLQKNAYFENAEVTRRAISQEGMKTQKIEIDLAKAMAEDPRHNILLRDYDHLIVRSIPQLNIGMTVSLDGQVKFPGTYPISTGERLSSVIERAGGFTQDAYLNGARLTRQSAKVVQERSRDDMIRQIQMYEYTGIGSAITESMAMGDELNSVTQNKKDEYISLLKAAVIDGRVVIRLSDDEGFKGSKYDVELEDGDNLDVPRMPGIVSVVGEVFNATSIVYEEGKPVKYYLACVGGVTKSAEEKQISVLKADGSVISRAQSRASRVAWDNDNRQWIFGGFMSLTLDPGDTIVVPRDVDRVPWLTITKDLTQIIFQIAVTAGVMAAL
jgi:protein involved in polysaccharide export with SLBB domain